MDKENSRGVNYCDFGYDISEALIVSECSNSLEWVLDLGCSFHLTPRKQWLQNFREINGGKVLLGNNHECKVQGVGDIRLKLHDGSLRTLTSMRYVPKLKRNLISLGELDRNCLKFKGEGGFVQISKGSLICMKVVLKNEIYLLQATTLCGEVATASINSRSKASLWHLRISHINEQELKELANQGILELGQSLELNKCESCILGKVAKVKFSKTAIHSSKAPLDYIHLDLWGPAQTETHGGSRYFLSIIDDFSRMLWAYVLKSKDNAFETFKTWKSMVENQKGRSVKVIRIDNGLEFCNREFDQMCKDGGIIRHLTTPENPKQNGVAERMNRTLLEKVRCKLFHAQLPKTFWGEAIAAAAHVLNKTPSKVISLQTPYEKWTSHKPSLAHLRVFSCLAYAHVK